jgi:hypothetical protein
MTLSIVHTPLFLIFYHACLEVIIIQAPNTIFSCYIVRRVNQRRGRYSHFNIFMPPRFKNNGFKKKLITQTTCTIYEYSPFQYYGRWQYLKYFSVQAPVRRFHSPFKFKLFLQYFSDLYSWG